VLKCCRRGIRESSNLGIYQTIFTENTPEKLNWAIPNYCVSRILVFDWYVMKAGARGS
jgi:hypothetical protein